MVWHNFLFTSKFCHATLLILIGQSYHITDSGRLQNIKKNQDCQGIDHILEIDCFDIMIDLAAAYYAEIPLYMVLGPWLWLNCCCIL